MKLSQALKEKNKLVKKIGNDQKLLGSNNSVIKGNDRDFNPEDLLKSIKENTVKLVKIKTAIAHANKPIVERIIRQGECKSLITFLKKLNTSDGQVQDRYRSSDPIAYEAHIKGRDVAREVETLEAEIEKIQAEIDEFNNTTFIAE